MEPTLSDLQRTRFRRYMQCKIARERKEWGGYAEGKGKGKERNEIGCSLGLGPIQRSGSPRSQIFQAASRRQGSALLSGPPPTRRELDLPRRVLTGFAQPGAPGPFPGHQERLLEPGLAAGTHQQQDTQDGEDESPGAPESRPGALGAPCPGARGGCCPLSPLPGAVGERSLSRLPRGDSLQSHQKWKCVLWGARSPLRGARSGAQLFSLAYLYLGLRHPR